MIFTNIDPWKVTAEQFEATCEARWPGLSLFIQNRFTGLLYNKQQKGGGGGGGEGVGGSFCSIVHFSEKLP